MQEYFTVTPEWMAACGYPKVSRTFRVIRKIKNPWRDDGPFAVMYVVDFDGREWTCAIGRGMVTDEHGNAYRIAVYLCDRTYGGPEEGGWYYDCGELVRACRKLYATEDDAYTAARRMNALLKASLNKGRRSISSVLSEGQYRARVCSGRVPPYFPETRPHYE